jgi:hypothetical protein
MLDVRKVLGVVLMMALSLTTGCMEGLSRSGSRTQWSEQKAWDWYDNQPWMVGCNYLPATACNQLEMWQAETFDPETIDRELGWAEDLGFNVIRVFLHDMMWAQDAEGFVKRIDQVLAIADDHNIKVMPILFDSCWNPLPKLGPQEIAQKYLHNSSWVQSPHRDTLTDMEQWPKLKAYVQGIVKRYRNDDRVLIWDVYNEPGNPNVPAYEKVETPHKGEYSLLLMKNAFDWIREMNPKQPLMASVWVGDWKKGNDIPALNQFALTHSDINQFHVYATGSRYCRNITARSFAVSTWQGQWDVPLTVFFRFSKSTRSLRSTGALSQAEARRTIRGNLGIKSSPQNLKCGSTIS